MIYKKIIVMFAMILFIPLLSYASQEQIRVDLQEYVDQVTYVNPLKYLGTSYGIWSDTTENQSYYNITGYITVTNNNPQNDTISDIYISFDYTTNTTLPIYFNGRSGSFISNNTASNQLILHIPEIQAGENSTWVYSVNTTNIRPPLNLTTTYSDTKVLAGLNFSVVDTLENVFDNASYQGNTCIYNIVLNQTTTAINFSGIPQDFYFIPSTLGGSDSGNVTHSNLNRTQYWNVLGNNCLNLNQKTNISYDINTPLNIPRTDHFEVSNTTLSYSLNQTISHLRVIDITAVSEADVSFEKKIISPSHPTLYGSNVTWNVSGYFNTDTNITYNLTQVTFWVSQRNVNGSYTDPNTIDVDPISGSNLSITSFPNTLVNSSLPWSSTSWLFNYSDLPSPIVWMDLNFTIQNDGTQLVNRSITQNGNDFYIKEIYLIIGYWLEIEKNITAIGADQYNIRIDVHNKGNQVTTGDAIVTIYDFVPSEFNLSSSMVYSSSTWYSTAHTNNSVSGQFNGTLHQWALIPSNILNTSLAQGPGYNANTTWYVEFNVTGQGDYNVMDVFVTGLDPQKVDGAGASASAIITEVLDKLQGTEGVFAIVASILLLIGLVL